MAINTLMINALATSMRIKSYISISLLSEPLSALTDAAAATGAGAAGATAGGAARAAGGGGGTRGGA